MENILSLKKEAAEEEAKTAYLLLNYRFKAYTTLWS